MNFRTGQSFVGIRSFISCAALLVATVLAPQSVSAAEPGSQLTVREPDGWWFEVQPYIWMSALGTEVDTGTVQAEADAEFSDLVDVLDKAIMLHAEAHNGPWGIFGDVFWTRLEKDENFGATGTLDVTLDMAIIEVGGYRRFYKQFTKRSLTFDAMLGARVGIFGTDVTIDNGAGASASSDETEVWAEPMIGGKVRVNMTPKFSTGIRADVSGFGIGSELTYNVNSEFRYRFSDFFALTFGYRYMSIDYETDNNVDIEVTMNGPVIGFLFTF